MPAAKSTTKKEKKAKTGSAGKLDVIFSGPLLFVPEVQDANITSVEVFFPRNGHPVGAIFLPGVFFTDAELDHPDNEKWPQSLGFSLLDPHSYLLDLTQTGKHSPVPISSISEANHKVKSGRKISADWDISIRIRGQISKWLTHRLFDVAPGMFHGSDAPKGATVAGIQRLTYESVTDADFGGVAPEPHDYLKSNIAQGGTLIVEGETPFQPSLLHERQAIDALAKLAGLNLNHTGAAPVGGKTRLMSHILPCSHSIILT